eukprot:TRINITY_DN71380_c0_g1_i1.p1 TRINITY_DN71380_c0_g1~~TRINITY_DN71380_c0_g1_i1.p1  ORF type:complete len:222 (+),score=65.59 TRINITY_DN71380_c0_g1_i1:84-749(+)
MKILVSLLADPAAGEDHAAAAAAKADAFVPKKPKTVVCKMGCPMRTPSTAGLVPVLRAPDADGPSSRVRGRPGVVPAAWQEADAAAIAKVEKAQSKKDGSKPDDPEADDPTADPSLDPYAYAPRPIFKYEGKVDEKGEEFTPPELIPPPGSTDRWGGPPVQPVMPMGNTTSRVLASRMPGADVMLMDGNLRQRQLQTATIHRVSSDEASRLRFRQRNAEFL